MSEAIWSLIIIHQSRIYRNLLTLGEDFPTLFTVFRVKTSKVTIYFSNIYVYNVYLYIYIIYAQICVYTHYLQAYIYTFLLHKQAYSIGLSMGPWLQGPRSPPGLLGARNQMAEFFYGLINGGVILTGRILPVASFHYSKVTLFGGKLPLKKTRNYRILKNGSFPGRYTSVQSTVQFERQGKGQLGTHPSPPRGAGISSKVLLRRYLHSLQPSQQM